MDELVRLLVLHDVHQLVDIRTVPRSRTNPQFNADALAINLPNRDIAYLHMSDLGGLRKARSDSPNTGWRNRSFRGYADYMDSSAFAEGLAQLMVIARCQTTAVMCAEALPWRCHRSLLADAALVSGVDVFHIMGRGALQAHVLTSFARVEAGRVVYPPTIGTPQPATIAVGPSAPAAAGAVDDAS